MLNIERLHNDDYNVVRNRMKLQLNIRNPKKNKIEEAIDEEEKCFVLKTQFTSSNLRFN